jgi:hypothetical protein
MRYLLVGLIAVAALCVGDVASAALLQNTTSPSAWKLKLPSLAEVTPVLMNPTPSSYDTLFGGGVGSRNGWLSNSSNGLSVAPSGNYIFSQTFSAGAFSSAIVEFDVLHDNGLKVRFNGVQVFASSELFGFTDPPDFVSFNLPAINGINANLIEFEVENVALPQGSLSQINPVGLTVKFRDSTRLDVIPEPASIVLWACAGGIGLLVRRRMSRSA